MQHREALRSFFSSITSGGLRYLPHCCNELVVPVLSARTWKIGNVSQVRSVSHKKTARLLLAILTWISTYFALGQSALGQTYTISTIAGSGLPILNIPGTQASLGFVQAVAADSAGNVFIAEENYPVVLRLDHITGILSLVAGNGTSGFSGDNGPATSAQLNSRILASPWTPPATSTSPTGTASARFRTG